MFDYLDDMIFVIEDEAHGEPGAQFATKEAALVELRRLAKLPWDSPPNQAPCMSWETCGRCYMLVEYDERWSPWRQRASVPMLEGSKKGVNWLAPNGG